MNTNPTELVFLLDRSGSMAGLEADTIRGFNAFIADQGHAEATTRVTVVLFDDRCETLWRGVEVRDARLTEKEYYVRGSTALLDATGKTILDVSRRLSREIEGATASKVIVVIITDGLENASCEFTYKEVKELIHHHQEIYNWEFIFLGANIDIAKEASNIGIATQDAHAFTATKAGVEKMYCIVNEAVTEKRRSRHRDRMDGKSVE